MSLAEALPARDPQAFGLLYDEHGPRLYAYCHTVLGDGAGDAVRDTFVAAARRSVPRPADGSALIVWLYTLARQACARRDAAASTVSAPPPTTLQRAVGRLRRDHREALALAAALEIDEAAEVLGVARDTADQMTLMARRRLEQAVLAVLAGRAAPEDDLLAALGQGRLDAMVAASAPEPPAGLRDRVLAACAAAVRTADPVMFDEDGVPMRLDALFATADAATRPHPVVRHAGGPVAEPAPAYTPKHAAPPARASARPVTRPGRRTHRATGASRRRREPAAGAAVLAACAAATVVGVMLWPAADSPERTSTVNGSTAVHRGSPSDRPGSSTTGATSLGRAPAPGGPQPAAGPGDRTVPGRTGPTAPASGTATSAASDGPSPTRSPVPSPRPTTPTPAPPPPGLPPLPGLTPSPAPSGH